MADQSSRELHVSLEAQEVLERVSPDALEKLDGDGSQNTEFGSCAASFALSWIGAGGTLDTFLEVVESSHLGQTYTRPSRVSRVLTRTYEWAEEHFDPTHTTGGVIEQLKVLRQRIEGADLPAGLRSTALVVVDKGISINAWSVDISVRDLSEQAGVSLYTAQQHLKVKFKEIGLATRLEFQGPNKARRVHLNLDYEPPSKGDHKVIRDHTYYYFPIMCMVSDHLLWTAHGVGQTAYRVYSSLGAVSISVADLIRATGLARNTVTKHLGVLVDLGLVVEIEGKRKRYCLNMMPDIDHAIATTGAVEKQQAKRDQYEQDRHQRQAWIEDHPEDAHRVFDAPQRVRSDIEWVLEGNIWQQDLISRDRRFWRYNRAGLDHLESLQWDDQLEFHITNPPLEYREYQEPEQPAQPPVDPFAPAVQVIEPVSTLPDHGDEPPF